MLYQNLPESGKIDWPTFPEFYWQISTSEHLTANTYVNLYVVYTADIYIIHINKVVLQCCDIVIHFQNFNNWGFVKYWHFLHPILLHCPCCHARDVIYCTKLLQDYCTATHCTPVVLLLILCIILKYFLPVWCITHCFCNLSSTVTAWD